jgi:hypothetical protein
MDKPEAMIPILKPRVPFVRRGTALGAAPCLVKSCLLAILFAIPGCGGGLSSSSNSPGPTPQMTLNVTGSWTGTITNSDCTFQWLANLTQSQSTVTGTVVLADSGGSQFFDVTGTLTGSTLAIAGPSQIPTSFKGTVALSGNALAWSGTFTVSTPNLGACDSAMTEEGTFQGNGALPSSSPSSLNVTGSWAGTITNEACTFQWTANLTQAGSTVTGMVTIEESGGTQFFDVTGTLSDSTLWIAGPDQIPTSFTGIVTASGNSLAWSGTFIVSTPNLGLCGSAPIEKGTFQGTG